MVSSDVSHQRDASESSRQPHETPHPETLSKRTSSESGGVKRIEADKLPIVVHDGHSTAQGASKALITYESTATSDLQHALTDLRTANKAKEVLLRTTRTELKNARDTLATTFAEYCGIRDEMKMLRHNITKEHQAIVYRKDIELFALRKANDLRDKSIREHEEEKKMLKETLAKMGRRVVGEDERSGEEAFEVRVLKVKKPRKSTSIDSMRDESDKDATITQLRADLAAAQNAAAEIVSQKGELQRAWDIAKNRQAAIKIERELHAQTKEQLQTMTVRLAESGSQPGRLPTIAENNDELEAMYDAAQTDNRRLYAENATLEQRLRESNARLFDAKRDAESLRNQGDEARQSVIQSAHFQRLEGQLTSARCSLTVKDHQLALLKETLTEKNEKMGEWKQQLDAAIAFHTQDQDEIERLKKELRRAKRESERLSLTNSKSSTSAAPPVVERTSARSSTTLIGPTPRDSARSSTSLTGPAPPPRSSSQRDSARSSTTLTNEGSTPFDTISALPPMPEEERNPSIQNTPTRHIRPDMQLINNDIPPAELRGMKRRSWDLRGMVKKIVSVKRDTSPVAERNNDQHKMRGALGMRDSNAPARPTTAVPTPATTAKHTPDLEDPFITSALPPMPPPTQRKMTPRYYAIPGPAQPQNLNEYRPTNGDEEERPRTSVRAKRATWGMGMGSGVKGAEGKEGMGPERTARKLKRRSIY